MTPVTADNPDAVRWEGWANDPPPVLGPLATRLAEWLHDGRARTVKDGPHRAVYQVELPGGSYHIKHNRSIDLRSWLSVSRARREARTAAAMAGCGLATIEPIAVGELRGWSQSGSYLVTRTLPGVQPVNNFISRTLPTSTPARRTRIRQRLASALGRFVGRMHVAGFCHNDLHLGNVVMRLDDNDEPALFITDLQSVQRRRRLPWRAARTNLLHLNAWCVLCTGRSDRLRFWRAYCDERGWPVEQFRSGARDVEARSWLRNLAFWRHRDKRCLATNRYYRRFQQGKSAGFAVRDLDQSQLQGLVYLAERLFADADRKDDAAAEVDVNCAGVPTQAILRCYGNLKWRERLGRLWRRGLALRAWVFGHGLRERGIPTPRPLAVWHSGTVWSGRRAYLLSEKPRYGNLKECLEQNAGQKRDYIYQVARVVRALHERGLHHGNLTVENVLVQSGAPSATAANMPAQKTAWDAGLTTLAGASFVGLDAAGYCSGRERALAHRDLAQLAASAQGHPALTKTDFLRFLRSYMQSPLRGGGGWKEQWRRIAHLAARRDQ